MGEEKKAGAGIEIPQGASTGKLKMKEQPSKLSYEQLSHTLSEMQNQANKMYQENKALKEALNNQGPIIRMNFLFEILKLKDSFSPEILISAAEEISLSMFPSRQKVEKEIDTEK